VYDKLFKQSRQNELIKLRIEAADIAEWMRYGGPKVDSISILNSLQPTLLRSIVSLIGLGRFLKQEKIFSDQPLPRDLYWNVDYDFTTQTKHVETSFHANELNSVFGRDRQQNGLYNEVEWIVTLMNLGTIPVDFDLIAIEDPLTGEVSCSQEGLRVDNCGAKSVKGSNHLFVRLLYTSDFTITSLHKNLLLRNSGWVQRFPIELSIDPKAILLANQFSNFSPITIGHGQGDEFSEKIPAIRFFIVLITIVVTF
jgi:hypothetical protein